MSSSEDELPSFSHALSFNNNRAPSRRNIDDIFEQNQLLVQQCIISKKTRVDPSDDADDVEVDFLNDDCADSPVGSHEQLPTCIFIKPKHLQYFSLNHLTLLKCGYDSVTELSSLEEFLITLPPSEIDKCIIQAGVLDAITNLNPFIHYILKTISLHKNRVFVDSSVKLIKDLSTKPDVERIQFSSGDIFKILFNCRCDVIESEIMKMVPDLRGIPIACSPEDFIPKHWLLNLKSVLCSLSELLQGCTISEEELCQVFKCLLLFGVESDPTIYKELQKCLVVTLNRISPNSWPMHRSIIALSLSSLTDIPIPVHWMYVYSLVKLIPITCSRGIELRQYASMMVLLNLAEADTLNHSLDYSDELFSTLKLKFILESLYDIEESLQPIAVKFLDIVINHLNFLNEENETLCMLLKRAEASFSKKCICQTQVDLVKIHAKVYSKLSKGIIRKENQESDIHQYPKLMDINFNLDGEDKPDEDMVFDREEEEEIEKEQFMKKDHIMDVQQSTEYSLCCPSTDEVHSPATRDREEEEEEHSVKEDESNLKKNHDEVHPPTTRDREVVEEEHFVKEDESNFKKNPDEVHPPTTRDREDVEKEHFVKEDKSNFKKNPDEVHPPTTRDREAVEEEHSVKEDESNLKKNPDEVNLPSTSHREEEEKTFAKDHLLMDEQNDEKDKKKNSFYCRSIRIGSYRVFPSLPMKYLNVILKAESLLFKAPVLTEPNKLIDVVLQKDDIEQLVIHFGKVLLIMFVYTTPEFGKSLRNALHMVSKDSPYFDPRSKDLTTQKLTFLIQEITEDQKDLIRNFFPGEKKVKELNLKTANEILVCSTPHRIRIVTNTYNQHSGRKLLPKGYNVKGAGLQKKPVWKPAIPQEHKNKNFPLKEKADTSVSSISQTVIGEYKPLIPPPWLNRPEEWAQKKKSRDRYSLEKNLVVDKISSPAVDESVLKSTNSKTNATSSTKECKKPATHEEYRSTPTKTKEQISPGPKKKLLNIANTASVEVLTNVDSSKEKKSLATPELTHEKYRSTPTKTKEQISPGPKKKFLNIANTASVKVLRNVDSSKENKSSATPGSINTGETASTTSKKLVPNTSPSKIGIVKGLLPKDPPWVNNPERWSRATERQRQYMYDQWKLSMEERGLKISHPFPAEESKTSSTNGEVISATSTVVPEEPKSPIPFKSIPEKMSSVVISDISPKSSKGRDTAGENNESSATQTLNSKSSSVQINSSFNNLLSFNSPKTKILDGSNKNTSYLPAIVSGNAGTNAVSSEVLKEPNLSISSMPLEVTSDISSQSTKSRDNVEENELASSVNTKSPSNQIHFSALDILNDRLFKDDKLDASGPKRNSSHIANIIPAKASSCGKTMTASPEVIKDPDLPISNTSAIGNAPLIVTKDVTFTFSKHSDNAEENKLASSQAVNTKSSIHLHSSALNLNNDNPVKLQKLDASELKRNSSDFKNSVPAKDSTSKDTAETFTEEPDQPILSKSLLGKKSLDVTSDVSSKSSNSRGTVEENEFASSPAVNTKTPSIQINTCAPNILNDKSVKDKPDASGHKGNSSDFTNSVPSKVSSSSETIAISPDIPKKPDLPISSTSVLGDKSFIVTKNVSSTSSKCIDTAEKKYLASSQAVNTKSSIHIHSSALNLLKDNPVKLEKPYASEPERNSFDIGSSVLAKCSSSKDTTETFPGKPDPPLSSTSLPVEMSLDITGDVSSKFSNRDTVEENELTSSRAVNTTCPSSQIHSSAPNILTDKPVKDGKLDASGLKRTASDVTNGVPAKVSRKNIATPQSVIKDPNLSISSTPMLGNQSLIFTSDVSSTSSKCSDTAEGSDLASSQGVDNKYPIYTHSSLNLLNDNPVKLEKPDSSGPKRISSDDTNSIPAKISSSKGIATSSDLPEELDLPIPSSSMHGKISLPGTSDVSPKSSKSRNTAVENKESAASQTVNTKSSFFQINSGKNVISFNPIKTEKPDVSGCNKNSLDVTNSVPAKVLCCLDTSATAPVIPVALDCLSLNEKLSAGIRTDVSDHNGEAAGENNESTASQAANTKSSSFQSHPFSLDLLKDNPVKLENPDASRPVKISSSVASSICTEVSRSGDSSKENSNMSTSPGSANSIATTSQEQIHPQTVLNPSKPIHSTIQSKLCDGTHKPLSKTVKILRFWHKYLCFQDESNLLQHFVACTLYSKTDTSGSSVINADIWPNQLQLQFIPQELVPEISSIIDSWFITIKCTLQSEALNKLHERMNSGMMGFVQFPENCNLRIMYVNRATKTNILYGVIPHDQSNSFLYIQKIYENYSKQQKNSGLQQDDHNQIDQRQEPLPIEQISDVNQVIDQLLKNEKFIASFKECTSIFPNWSFKKPSIASETSLFVPETPFYNIPEKTSVNDSNIPVSGKSSSDPETLPIILEAHTISEAPPNILEAHTISEAPPNILEAPPNILEVAQTISETAQTISETAHTISEAPPNFLEAPPTILEAAQTISETAHTISETAHTISETQPSVPEETTVNEDTIFNLYDIPETYSVYDSNVPIYSSDIADISICNEPCIYSENADSIEFKSPEDKTDETNISDDELEIVAILPPKSQSPSSIGTSATSSAIVKRNKRAFNDSQGNSKVVCINDSPVDSDSSESAKDSDKGSSHSLRFDIVVSHRSTNPRNKKKYKSKKKKRSDALHELEQEFLGKLPNGSKKRQNTGNNKERSSKQSYEQSRPKKRLRVDNESTVKRSQSGQEAFRKRPCEFDNNILQKRPKVNNVPNQNQEKSASASNISSLSNELQDDDIEIINERINYSSKKPLGIITLD